MARQGANWWHADQFPELLKTYRWQIHLLIPSVPAWISEVWYWLTGLHRYSCCWLRSRLYLESYRCGGHFCRFVSRGGCRVGGIDFLDSLVLAVLDVMRVIPTL